MLGVEAGVEAVLVAGAGVGVGLGAGVAMQC